MDRRQQRRVLAAVLSCLLPVLLILPGAPRLAEAHEPLTAPPSPSVAPSPTPAPSPSIAAPVLSPTPKPTPKSTPPATPKPESSPHPTPPPPSPKAATTPPATPGIRPSPAAALPGPASDAKPPRAGVAGNSNNNLHLWEGRWWTHLDHPDHLDKEIPNRVIMPLAPGNGNLADVEDSAAVQRVIEQLPPDERAVFLRNFKRWAQLTIEERQTLRRQATERRQRMMEETESALRETGLHLDDDQREVFMLRYSQERRKLERELQEQITAERARRTPEIIERLKREFEATTAPPAKIAGPTVTAVPTLTPLPHP